MKSITLLALTFLLAILQPLQAQIAIQGETVYPVDGPALKNGVVLLQGSKIQQIGIGLTIPPGYRVLKAKVVTPGLVDAHTVVGIAGVYNYPQDQNQLEKSNPIQPELRAVDAYNAQEALVTWVRTFGVTTIHTGPSPGALASGQTMVVKTIGNTLQDSLLQAPAMVAFTLGSSVSSNYKSPGTRSKGVALLREEFLKAQSYAKKQKNSPDTPRDLKLEVLSQVLNRELPALITAHTVTDMMGALRLAEEFKFKLVLDGAAESYLILDELKQAGISVLLHPTLLRNAGEGKNATFETAAKLNQKGIPFAIQSGYEGYVPKTRVILLEAAIAAANGLPFEAALASITLNAAKIIGLDQKIGSLTVGKDADVVLFDGDPFEYTTHVCTVIINGVVVSDTCR